MPDQLTMPCDRSSTRADSGLPRPGAKIEDRSAPSQSIAARRARSAVAAARIREAVPRTPSRRDVDGSKRNSHRAASAKSPARRPRPRAAIDQTPLLVVRPQVDHRRWNTRAALPRRSPDQRRPRDGRRHLAQTAGVGTTRRIRARTQNGDTPRRPRAPGPTMTRRPSVCGSGATGEREPMPGVGQQRRDRARHQHPQRRLRSPQVPSSADCPSAASQVEEHYPPARRPCPPAGP